MQDINGIEDIRVDSPFEFYELNHLAIHGRVNEHGHVVVSGIIKQDEILDHVPQGKNITIWGKDQNRPLFSGIIKSLCLSKEGGLQQVTVEAISYTSLLDQVLCSRSFQNSTMRYRDLLNAARERFEQKSRILVTAKEASRNIGAPVIQYQETNWEFLKRIAGRIHTVLISESTYPMAQLSIGFIHGEFYNLEEPVEYEEYLDLDRFRRWGARKPKEYYISYRIKTCENYELGDRIQWKGKEFRVVQKKLLLERGRLEGEYLLGFEQEFCLEGGANKKIRGTSLSGTVIDRKEGMLRVHLDIDSEQDQGQAYWYPYSPVTGNIMYSVPEIGTGVLLNIKSEREEDAVVNCCVRGKSDISLPTEIKTMWADGTNYTAAPEFMVFHGKETSGFVDAFALDDTHGLLMCAKKRLCIRAKGTVMIGSSGFISMNGVTKTNLIHPKGKEERAWIAMDCGRMRMGGSFVVHSGVMTNKDVDQTNEIPIGSDAAIAESLSMIPIAVKSTVLQDVGLQTEIYRSLSGGISNADQTGKVIQMYESVNSAKAVEKDAYIYVGGYFHAGEVRNGETYVKQNYNLFLDHFFTGVDKSLYSIETTVNETTGESRSYINKLYNISVERLAQETGYSEMLSSWEYTDTARVVVCNTMAKNGPYQLVRKGNKINIKLYAKINALKKDDNDDSSVRKVKPYENEKSGWFESEEDKARKNYSFYDFITIGMQKWEGVYKNNGKKDYYYDNPEGKWWTGSIYSKTISYDYFGLDGAVEVKVELCSPTDQHPTGTRIYIFDNREKLISETVYDENNDKDIAISEERNWPCITDYRLGGFQWSVVYLGTMLLYTRLFSKEKQLDYSYSSNELIDVISHEFGHFWGLHDAYKKSDDWPGAEITKEVSKNNIMINNDKVQSNDIEMILQAYKANEWQYYFDWETHKKSVVIRLE